MKHNAFFPHENKTTADADPAPVSSENGNAGFVALVEEYHANRGSRARLVVRRWLAAEAQSRAKADSLSAYETQS